jgi:hypothetical protein
MRRQVWPKVAITSPTRRAALGGLGALAACDQKAPPDVARKPLENARSARIDLPGGGTALMMRYDIAKTAIDHICLEVPAQGAKVGEYYPNSKSPAFKRLDASAVARNFQAAHGANTQVIINCSFFERYDLETELSFPLKRDGKILTGGSSVYGPCQNPADDRYKKVTLKALVWNNHAINVVDYDHSTGGVLNDPSFPNGLVTYDYRDHPANILSGDPVGRYQLLGTSATLDGSLPDVLFTLTIEKGRMVDGAAALKRQGVSGSILTVDGGPSTHFWLSETGDIVTTESKSLPHYLGFRARA